MPRTERSLAITEAYQQRVFEVRRRLENRARAAWPSIQSFDRTTWPALMAQAVARAQIEGVRAAVGYATAYLSSELGRRTRAIVVNARDYAGKTRDGRPLGEAYDSPLIGVKAALAGGQSEQDALDYGLNRGLRMVSIDYDQAHRSALLDLIGQDDRFEGWKRAVSGTCGACLAASAEEIQNFETHPNCECVPEPVVRDVPDHVPRLVGAALFASMSAIEQDNALGSDTAELVRSGDVPLHRLLKHDRLAEAPDFITQRPLEALT